MLICKAHAVLHKIERGKEALDEAYSVAQNLKSAEICSFLDVCRVINDNEISLKKRTQSQESVRKRRSRLSISSRLSTFSHQSDASRSNGMNSTDSKMRSN